MFRYELIVMGFLLERPMYGYQINREIRAQGMDFWAKIDNPMVYLTMAKLDKKGMIRKSKVEREGLMPERRIYRLTSKGKERLANLVEGVLMEKNLTYDLSNLGYFFLFVLPIFWMAVKVFPHLPDPKSGAVTHEMIQTTALDVIGKEKAFLNIISLAFLGLWAYAITQAYFKAKEIDEEEKRSLQEGEGG